MVMPLNRLATLTLAGPPMQAPVEYTFSTYSFTTGALPANTWQLIRNPFSLPQDLDPPRMASAMARGDELAVSTDAVGTEDFPTEMIAAGQTVSIIGPAGALVWDITDVSVSTIRRAVIMSVDNGALQGDDFQVTAGITVGFSAITAEQAGQNVNRDVYCRITERGAESSLIAIESSTEITRNVDSAEFSIRWIDPRTYTRLVSILDDLGRTWTIDSFRASDNRRYLYLDTSRNA